jgi:hypothetical protein
LVSHKKSEIEREKQQDSPNIIISSMTTTTTAAGDAALRHLKTLKPLDGWSIEKQSSKGYRLCRRNVPLTDNFFLDIHYEATPELVAVVGILTKNSARGGGAQAQVLVDRHGQAVGRKISLVTVHTWGKSSNSYTSSSSTSRNAAAASASAPPPTGLQLTDEQNMQLIKYVGGGLLGLSLLRIVFQGLSIILLCLLPLLYLYLVQHCPSNASFDAKKELKRVMRGYWLPDDDPNKPRGFLNETLARLNATVTTELGTCNV